MPRAQLYQIFYHCTSPAALDPGFLVLDNSANLRPDWYEYWPIRNFLLSHALDDAAFYGFFSPKFKLKTNLSAAQAEGFCAGAADADVVLFSPSIQNTAYHLNVFTHGEAECPGLLDLSKALFERLGIATDLDSMISDSRNTVNSNYFAAKPRFWRAWLAITEALFAIAETPGDPLGARLRAPTSYRGRIETPMKTFVIERIASWLITHDPSFTTRVRDPFVARSRIYKLPVAIICDALKIAYATERRSQYKDVFELVSGLYRSLNWEVRIAAALGLRRVRPYLDSLAAHWIKL
jgi:hypothetical protein